MDKNEGQEAKAAEASDQGRKLDLNKPNQTELERMRNLLSIPEDDMKELSKNFIVTTLKSSLGLLSFEKNQVDKYVSTLERWVTVLESRLCEAGLLDAGQTTDMEPASLKFTELNFKIDALMKILEANKISMGEGVRVETFIPGPVPSPVAMPDKEGSVGGNPGTMRDNGSLAAPGGRIMPPHLTLHTAEPSITASVTQAAAVTESSNIDIISKLPNLNILQLGLVLNCYCKVQKPCGDLCHCCRYCQLNANTCGMRQKRQEMESKKYSADKIWSRVGQEEGTGENVPDASLNEIYISDAESEKDAIKVDHGSFSGGCDGAGQVIAAGILSGGLISAEVILNNSENKSCSIILKQEGFPSLTLGQGAARHMDEYLKATLGKPLVEVAQWMTDLVTETNGCTIKHDSPDSGVSSVTPDAAPSPAKKINKADIKKILAKACYKCHEHMHNMAANNQCLDQSVKLNSPLRLDVNYWDKLIEYQFPLSFRRPRVSRSKEKSDVRVMGPPPPRTPSRGRSSIPSGPTGTKRIASRSPSVDTGFRPRSSTASSTSPMGADSNCNITPIRRSVGSEDSDKDMSMATANSSLSPNTSYTKPEITMLSKSTLVWWNRDPDNVFTYGSMSEMDTTAGSSRTDDWSSGYDLPFSGGKSQTELDNQPSITCFLSKNSVYKKVKRVVKRMKRKRKVKSLKTKRTMMSVSGSTTNTKTEDDSLGSFCQDAWL